MGNFPPPLPCQSLAWGRGLSFLCTVPMHLLCKQQVHGSKRCCHFPPLFFIPQPCYIRRSVRGQSLSQPRLRLFCCCCCCCCCCCSHFHLDHCGALPYFTEMCGYEGPIYMTHPTKAICPILLVRKHTWEGGSWRDSPTLGKTVPMQTPFAGLCPMPSNTF